MPELRWTLLIIGVVFIVALAWWERRRPHQAPRESSGDLPEVRPSSGPDSGWGPAGEPAGPRFHREPTLTLPEIRVRESSAPQDLPVVRVGADDSLEHLVAGGPGARGSHRDAVEPESAALEPEPIEAGPIEADSMEADSIEADSMAAEAMEPMEAEPLDAPAMPLEEDSGEGPVEPAAPQPLRRPPERLPAARSPSSPQSPPPLQPPPLQPPRRPGAQPQSNSAPPPPAAQAEPSVDWPPEEVRRLISLRLVAPPQARFPGRAVRQALAAEGFVFGKFSIFHKPDAQNRAVLSAASLTKPGSFDLETMDTQRFGGLNLFAVLPGPKAPLKAFEELLATARTLNERLEGALQDERGGPLTPTRVAALREALGAEAGA